MYAHGAHVSIWTCEVYVRPRVLLFLHEHMEVRVQHLVFSIALHMTFGGKASHWTCCSPVWRGWEPQWPSCLWPINAGITSTITARFHTDVGDLNLGSHACIGQQAPSLQSQIHSPIILSKRQDLSKTAQSSLIPLIHPHLCPPLFVLVCVCLFCVCKALHVRQPVFWARVSKHSYHRPGGIRFWGPNGVWYNHLAPTCNVVANNTWAKGLVVF